MSVTISYLNESVIAGSSDMAHEMTLSVEEIKTIVTALHADPEHERHSGLIFLDDNQFGYVADDVAATYALRIITALGGAIAEKLGELVALAAAHDLTLSFDERRDMRHNGEVTPLMRVNSSHSDDVSANWSNWHAEQAFRTLGLTFSCQDGAQFTARELAAQCAKFPHDDDAVRLAEIAAYAMRRGGPDATVVAG